MQSDNQWFQDHAHAFAVRRMKTMKRLGHEIIAQTQERRRALRRLDKPRGVLADVVNALQLIDIGGEFRDPLLIAGDTRLITIDEQPW
jgi:hypothetical protein